MNYFAGLDWGSASHAVCVIDGDGQIVRQLAVTHDAEGLKSLERELDRISPVEPIPVAIERPSGLVVDTLLQAAIRILARAWVRVLWKIWTSRTPYDPTKHTGAAPFLKAA